MKIFYEDSETRVEKCKRFVSRYFHPAQISTGIFLGSVGFVTTATGFMYADGMNFLFHGAQQIPQQLANGTDLSQSIDYMRESYKVSMEEAFAAGSKQFPFAYCVGHFIGGKIRDKFSSIFGRKHDG